MDGSGRWKSCWDALAAAGWAHNFSFASKSPCRPTHLRPAAPTAATQQYPPSRIDFRLREAGSTADDRSDDQKVSSWFMRMLSCFWRRKSEQKNKPRSSLCCGLVIVNGLRVALWFGVPWAYSSRTGRDWFGHQLRGVARGRSSDPFRRVRRTCHLHPAVWSESTLFSRMVLDLRTLSANLTSPNHNNIHSHVVSHDLFRSDDVGRRWLSTCLLFHIIFLTTLIASPLFLQCLVSYHRSEIHRLIVILSPLQDPLSRHHLIITIRRWSAYKISYHHNKMMVHLQHDLHRVLTSASAAHLLKMRWVINFFARPQDATSIPRTFKL